MISKRICFGLLLLLFSNPGVTGQEVNVTASFDTTRILIGDQTGFTVSIEKPRNMNLLFPFLKDTLSSHIEILSGPVADSSELPGDRIRVIRKYLVTSFDTGFHRIDPVYAEINDAGGLRRFYSGTPVLEVGRYNVAPSDTSMKIYDIVSPYRAPVTLGEIMPWIMLVTALALLASLIYRYARLLKRHKKVPQVALNPDPAHIIAFRELEKLRDEKVWQSGEIKRYYTRLTEILRQYLENRFGVLSLELTTSETLDVLVRKGFKKNEQYNLLKSVLTGADLVKFAKYNPSPDENELNFDQSWRFIEETKPEENPGPVSVGDETRKEEKS